MDEYIRRDAVHDAVSKLKRLAWMSSTTNPNSESCVAVELDAVHLAIERIPAADVRPVVLCRDCRSYNKPRLGYCETHLERVHRNDYCSYGKKREES